MDIGKKVRDLRIKNNLTLEELANRTELSKGFLSQLENNLTSPSISTLEDIISVLGSSLESFFKNDEKEQIVFGQNDYFIDEHEEYTIEWIVPNAIKNEMEPILLTIKGKGKGPEIYPHDGEEFGYVLSGQLKIESDVDSKQTIKKGETFYFKGDYRHCLINEKEKECRLIWISTAPIF